MDLTDIVNIRLISQRIAKSRIERVKDNVEWMGAIQAQDYEMAKWAVGVRLPTSTNRSVEAAISRGEILRTHLLRPTWHFVSAEDIYWMLALSAPGIKASIRSREKDLELTGSVLAQSDAVIEKALQGGKHLTRAELQSALENAGIATGRNRLSHFLLRSELDGIACSGEVKAGKQTYALLEQRAPRTAPIPKEEAIAKLAKTYFMSRGPATLQDFVWWSGLSTAEAKQGLETVKADFLSETIRGSTYWFFGSSPIPSPHDGCVYFLPAYDEFILSYADRSAALQFEDLNKAVSNNGIFRPVIVVDGQVAGIWKRTIKNDKVSVETFYFRHPDQKTTSLIENAAEQYGQFLDKKTETVLSMDMQNAYRPEEVSEEGQKR
jgi:hypothetical protein